MLTGGGAAADTSGESELAAAVHEALAGLRLSGDPVGEVQEARSGRPVRYEAKARRVLLNPRHESLAWTRGRAPRDPAVVALLVAAAVERRGDHRPPLRVETVLELAADRRLREVAAQQRIGGPDAPFRAEQHDAGRDVLQHGLLQPGDAALEKQVVGATLDQHRAQQPGHASVGAEGGRLHGHPHRHDATVERDQ